MSGDFDDDVVVITGAASGIGRSAAITFAREGARVVLADVDVLGLDETLELISRSAGTAIAVPCDVCVESDVADLMAAAVDAFGRIDVLCNNAGVGGSPGPVPTWLVPDAEWDRLFDINLRSAIYGVRHAAEALIATGGRIVNTASLAGLVVLGTAPYGVSKAALIQLTRGLAVELAPHGVRVNCVCPGSTATNFAAGRTSPQKATGYSSIPLARQATADEIAEGIVYLASRRSSYATGVALVLDGGFSIT